MDTTKEASDFFKQMPWEVINSYFCNQHLERLVRHQIESYNDFINYQILRTVEMFNPVHVASENDFDAKSGKYALELWVTFENFSMQRPQFQENNGAIRLNFPQISRLRNLTYASSMTLDLNIRIVVRKGPNLEIENTYLKIIPKIQIGKMPIMIKSCICLLEQYKHHDHVRSGECKYDAGGYFIINGSEKTVLGQERAAENKVYVYNVAKGNNKYSFQAEIKCVPDYKCISPKQIIMMISQKNNGFGNPIYVQLPKTKQAIPLFVLFRVLGVVSDRDICSTIVLDIGGKKQSLLMEGLLASIIDANKLLSQEDCVKYFTSQVIFSSINMDRETGQRKKNEFAQDLLETDLFPHCQNRAQKIWFLGYMANKLLQVRYEWLPMDDRDSYLNKRVDMTGTLLNNLFRNYFNKLVKDMEKQMCKEINSGSWRGSEDYMNIVNQSNVYRFIKSTTIENGIRRALATGDFGIKHINNSKVGVAQVLSHLTYVSTLSHLRRISTPIDKSGKLVPPRRLNNTCFGFICPVETPEGQSVGVVKNLSYMTHVTIASNPLSIYEIMASKITALTQDVSMAAGLYDQTKVFINGCWVGVTSTPMELFLDLKSKKRAGILNIYTSVVFDYRRNEIRVCSDAGRLLRPLFVVDRTTQRPLVTTDIVQRLNKTSIQSAHQIESASSSSLSWEDLLTNMRIENAVIEYIDPEEQATEMIAMWSSELSFFNPMQTIRFSYMEIHPSTILGVLASCIPFAEHNQSPRNTYQCAQAKQAMGVYVSNYEHRMDKTAYVLTTPGRPLVDTRIMDMLHLNEIPSGYNVTVAIMSYTGYNQEDSLLFNKGAIDRGLFQTTVYHTEKDEDKQKVNGEEEIRCRPDATKTKGMKFGNYGKLQETGLMPENALVEHGDIIIGKVVPIKEHRTNHMQKIKFSDESKMYRTNGEECYIEKNYTTRNGDGYKSAKVKIRSFRNPQIGDKFSSRSGQKGTIGNIIPEEDMPFTRRGLKPDIILNPHAIPSRMTIAQLKETLLGKVLIEMGLFGDGTSFGDLEISRIAEQLQNLGYESKGNEIMYDPATGEQMECSIFIGPCFYQRLKHMVIDKQHSRSIGPMVNLTRQPAEGRSRSGGLRFGEMERDCVFAHGAASFIKDRMYYASDKYNVHVCKGCGMIAAFNDATQIHWCRFCNNRVEFSNLEIPYSFKLLTHELMSMNIAPRFITN